MNQSILKWIEGRPAPVVEAAFSYLGVKKLRLKFSVLRHMRHHMPRQFRKVQKSILVAGIEAAEANPRRFNELLAEYEWLVDLNAKKPQAAKKDAGKPVRGFKLRLAHSSTTPVNRNGDKP